MTNYFTFLFQSERTSFILMKISAKISNEDIVDKVWAKWLSFFNRKLFTVSVFSWKKSCIDFVNNCITQNRFSHAVCSISIWRWFHRFEEFYSKNKPISTEFEIKSLSFSMLSEYRNGHSIYYDSHSVWFAGKRLGTHACATKIKWFDSTLYIIFNLRLSTLLIMNW